MRSNSRNGSLRTRAMFVTSQMSVCLAPTGAPERGPHRLALSHGECQFRSPEQAFLPRRALELAKLSRRPPGGGVDAIDHDARSDEVASAASPPRQGEAGSP